MEEVSALGLAIDRYKHGKCPQCGKEKGDPNGLQIRKVREIPKDIYCHTCRTAWPLEMDEAAIESRLRVIDGGERNRTVVPPSKEEVSSVSRSSISEQKGKRGLPRRLLRWLARRLGLGY
jgi:hypothetical protein